MERVLQNFISLGLKVFFHAVDSMLERHASGESSLGTNSEAGDQVPISPTFYEQWAAFCANILVPKSTNIKMQVQIAKHEAFKWKSRT